MDIIMNYIKIDGVDSREFGFYAYEREVHTGAERVYEDVVILGRNGSVKLDTQRYANVPHSYDLICYDRAERHIKELRAFVASLIGYRRLEDSYENDYYYIACFEGGLEPTLSRDRNKAKVKLEFTRKPERYLKIGEEPIVLTESSTLVNPTLYQSKPIIKAYGGSGFSLNGNAVNISASTDYVGIDSESMECYYMDQSMNANVSLQNNEYPILQSGTNVFELTSGTTKLEIIPRWYTL